MVGLPTIHCALCDKPVDAVVAVYNESDQSHVLIARCHGDRDTMKVNAHELADKDFVDAFHLAMTRGGVAFSTPRVEGKTGCTAKTERE